MDRLEQLIARSLDGLANEDEQLALNRELACNRDARQAFDDFRRVDGLASEALQQAIAPRDTDSLVRSIVHRPRRNVMPAARWSWLVPGAIAAALLAAAITQVPSLWHGSSRPMANQSFRTAQPPHRSGLVRTVADSPPRERITRDVARNVYGIMGDDGRIYWIEVDHTLQMKLPDADAFAETSRQEM